MEKVAATSNKIDSLVLLDDPLYAPTAGSVVLHVVRHLRKPGQELIDGRTFESLDGALAFCEHKYGVLPDNWQDVLPVNATFSYKYEVTHLGTPQPILVFAYPGKIQFLVDTANEDVASDVTSYQLHICGDRDGLRRLAALLLLAADSEALDKHYHGHLDATDDVVGNASMLIHGPGSFPLKERNRDRAGRDYLQK